MLCRAAAGVPASIICLSFASTRFLSVILTGGTDPKYSRAEEDRSEEHNCAANNEAACKLAQHVADDCWE